VLLEEESRPIDFVDEEAVQENLNLGTKTRAACGTYMRSSDTVCDCLRTEGQKDTKTMVGRVFNMSLLFISLVSLTIVIQIIRRNKNLQMHPANLIKTICIVEAIFCWTAFIQAPD